MSSAMSLPDWGIRSKPVTLPASPSISSPILAPPPTPSKWTPARSSPKWTQEPIPLSCRLVRRDPPTNPFPRTSVILTADKRFRSGPLQLGRLPTEIAGMVLDCYLADWKEERRALAEGVHPDECVWQKIKSCCLCYPMRYGRSQTIR